MAGNEDPQLSVRLGYLLKHAHLLMVELSTEALRPYGIEPRELPVLGLLTGPEPASQQEVARRLGVDRTTMVALLDALAAKGLVARHPHATDRRRNVVGLTEAGRDTLRRAEAANAEAERELLAPLGAGAADQLRAALRTVLAER